MSDSSPADFVASRQIGDATVSIISEGVLMGEVALPLPEAEWRPLIPEADASGIIPYGLNFLHIRIGNASILVDPSGLDDPTTGMVEHFAARYPAYIPTPGLAAGLASIGVQPQEITHVLITHAHGDHFRGMLTVQNGEQVARFANARHLVGLGDWNGAYAREHPHNDRTLCFGTVERLGLLETVGDEREVVPGVTMIPAPGESPGHCILRVRSAGETFYYLGDLFHYVCEVEHPDWMDRGRDAEAMRLSRNRLMADVADSDAILVYTHSPFPGWGRIVSTRTGFRWEFL
jgi:glyoxylase-like metal-dependent hydrolase (beta-lactamase superfamily II)